MTKVQQLERQVAELTAVDLAIFRKWFSEFDGEMWDRQIEADVHAGRLDALARRALRDHAAGKSHQALIDHVSPDFWACYRALPG